MILKRSIKPVKMMDRAVAMSDAQAVGGGDRFRDPCLRVAHGRIQRFAFGKASGNRRRERTSGAVGIGGRKARRTQGKDIAADKEIIDALCALPVTALDQRRLSPHRE